MSKEYWTDVPTSPFPLVTQSLLAPMCPTSYAEGREAGHVLTAFLLWTGSPASLCCFELCALQTVPDLEMEVEVALKTRLLPSMLRMHPKLHGCVQAEGPCFSCLLFLGKSFSNERCRAGERSSRWLNGSGFCHPEMIELLDWILCLQPCSRTMEV